MLSAINQGPCFTGAEYNVLRVIAAFPRFSTRAKAVAAALQNDHHPIATIREDLLMESLARESKVTEILPALTIRHKRAKCTGTDDEVPARKRKK
jgi:hypothetical protein